MTITEFLEARIAEDEAIVERRGAFPHAVHGRDVIGTYSPHCPDCLGVPGRARVLAECAAKRALIEICSRQEDRAAELGYWDFDATEIPRTLAAVYADHHDYDPEWKA